VARVSRSRFGARPLLPSGASGGPKDQTWPIPSGVLPAGKVKSLDVDVSAARLRSDLSSSIIAMVEREQRIRVGTASWTDPTLTKETNWYPRRSMSAEERLRFYATQFPVVEVDATYYHPPTEDLAARWAERTPVNFLFDIKAFGLFTGHPAKREALWPDVAADLPDEGKGNVYLDHLPATAVDRAWELFRTALMPLHSAGKLGAVFFQFPPWFRPNRRNQAHIAALPERLPDYTIAVEFRHSSWLTDDERPRTLERLKRHGLAYVCVDEPQGFETSVPPLLTATTDLAVVRMHGHTVRTGSAKASRPRSGSVTSTQPESWRRGHHGSRTWRAKRARPMWCSTTATAITGSATPPS
jgi:uncharacterized protein YecE (DUF72 family)